MDSGGNQTESEALISSFLGADDDNNSMADDNPVSQQFQMAKALSVLQIKASTFHSLHFSGKHDEVKKLFDNALKERMKVYWSKNYGAEEKKEIGFPTLDETDIQTIHEAFQFLMKKYVIGAKSKKPTFLSIEQLHKNQLRISQGRENEIKYGEGGEKKRRGSMVDSRRGSVQKLGGGIDTRRGSVQKLTLPKSPSAGAKPLDSSCEDVSDQEPPETPTTKISQQLSSVNFEPDYTEKLSMEIDATFSYDMSEVDPVLLKMRPPQPPDFLEPQLNRRKSVRRSFRKKKTGEDGEPYSLLRKGSDKLKSLRAFKQAGKKREAGKK